MESVILSKTPKIYKNSSLNHASFQEFSHTDYRVFLHLISKIGGVDEFGKYLQPNRLKRTYTLTAAEFNDVFQVPPTHCYSILKKAVNRLMKTDIRVQKPEEDSYWRINICSQAEYKKKEGKIIIEFTDRIMPYLAQVKQKFLLYNLKEISNFKSIYTTRLYELLQEFKETGWMLKSIEQLRETFAVGDKFKVYNNFKRRTFVHACDEINKIYHMSLRFEEIKNGLKIVAIKFFFRQTKVQKITNQITGVTRNVYEKPTPSVLKKRQYTKRVSSDKELDAQTMPKTSGSFQSLQGILSSLVSGFNKKK